MDFDDSFERTRDSELLYARFVAGACREHGLRPFSAAGIARLIAPQSVLMAMAQPA